MKLDEAVRVITDSVLREQRTVHLDIKRLPWGDRVATAATIVLFPAPREGMLYRIVRYAHLRQAASSPVESMQGGSELRALLLIPTFQRASYEDATGYKQTLVWGGNIDELRERPPSAHRNTSYTWPALGEERIFNPTSLRDYPSILDL